MKNTPQFFATARERESIRRKRLAGLPPPWTEDRVFQNYRFCNVHRENDRTTQWFRDHVRSKVTGLRAVEATVQFRWFNRIESGERIVDLLTGKWDSEEARRRLEDVRPVVTGAYMIKTETGLSKLDGVLLFIDKAMEQLPRMYPAWGESIERVVADLSTIRGLGPFLAYEIATDLRHTDVLGNARDIMTWANAGPGACAGLSRLYDLDDHWRWNRKFESHQQEMVTVMQRLVKISQDPNYWPAEWEPWEMREAEHWACEFDKHCRGMQDKRLKRRFHAE